MKKIGMNSKIRKVAVAAILVAVLIGFSMAMIAPVVEASDVPTLDSQLAGSFNFGTAGISDPDRIETGEGYYMHPYSYVYLGEVYNSVTKSYDVVICRVLDADSDILGNPGAMLLYTESAIDPTYFYRYSTEYTDLIGTENIYASSTLARLEANGKYSLRSHYGRHFDNVPEPEDFLRPVTKTDVKANMSGLYTDFLAGIDHSKYPSLVPDFVYIFSFETDTVKEDSGPYYVAEKSDSIEALNNATFFPLSAEEFNKYMGSLSSSKNYVSKYTLTGDGVSYWLRTGIYEQVDLPGGDYDNWESQFAGNLVLGVDPDGNLTAIPAEKEGIYGRFAFNFETESISYTRKIDGVHKLAFADSRYAEGDLFEAEIVNTENGIVTLKYTNAIRSRSTVWYGEDEVEYVSVIIKDEYGNVKSYASIAEVPQCYYAEDEEKKSSESYTAEFLLPEDYDEENDTILVFWERKSSDERKPSFTSNMVELDCAHTYYNEDGSYDKLPTCTAQGSCAICGDDFGEFDPENHPNMENGEYKYDDAENKHWNICPDCGADGEYEDCTFINYCIAPCVCGNIDENSIHHDYGDNGVCRRDQSHYEKPEMTVYGYYNIVVRIKNEGNWLWLANQIAEGKKQYVIWETYSVYLDDDLDFKYLDFVPLGTQENPFVGELDSLGRNYTISNISYSDTDRDGVGIIGVGKNVKIKNINVENVTFEGKDYVGALVGAATNVDVEGITVKGNVDINAMGDKVGAFFGSCDMDSSIRLSFSYTTLGGVLNYLPGTGEGTPTIDTSFFLAEENGDGGSLSEEGFASGAVAYSFNQTVPGLGWRQTVVGDETDAYPKRRGDTNYENSIATAHRLNIQIIKKTK